MNAACFLRLILRNRVNRAILDRLSQSGLRDAWVTSGCLFQTVWNLRTGRDPQHGIRDYDIFYFDDSDLSWEAENASILGAQQVFDGVEARIEIRNQARVHLWYEAKFGLPYAPLRKTTDGIDRFLATACMVGVQPAADGPKVYAPKGFTDLEALVLRPNPVEPFDTATYLTKADRWCQTWPELTALTPPAPRPFSDQR